MPMVNPPAIDVGLKLTKWVTDLATMTVPNDIFDASSENYVKETGSDVSILPEAITVKVDGMAEEGTNKIRLTLIEPYSNAECWGTTSQVGREETIKTRFFDMFYNSVSHAVVMQNYGVEANNWLPYVGKQLEKVNQKQEANYWKELRGKYRRQALLERGSYNLTATAAANDGGPGTAAPLVTGLHPNWYVPSLTFSAQPAVSLTATATNLGAAMAAAGFATAAGGTNADKLKGDVNEFIVLEEYARTQLYITPLKHADGTDGYVVVLPPAVARRLKLTSLATGFSSLGNLFVAGGAMPKEMLLQYPTAIGRIGGLVFIEDMRAPNLTWTGTTAFTPTYRQMGMGTGSDPRTSNGNDHMVGFLLGAGALYEWMPESYHWQYNYSDYDQNVGAGLFAGLGYQAPIFNSTAGATKYFNQSSICIPFGR